MITLFKNAFGRKFFLSINKSCIQSTHLPNAHWQNFFGQLSFCPHTKYCIQWRLTKSRFCQLEIWSTWYQQICSCLFFLLSLVNPLTNTNLLTDFVPGTPKCTKILISFFNQMDWPFPVSFYSFLPFRCRFY